MTDEDRVEALRALARQLGVETEYWDVAGERHVASIDALLAVVSALGHPVDGLAAVPDARRAAVVAGAGATTEPVVVAWGGRPFGFDVRLPVGVPCEPVQLSVALEDGGAVELAPPTVRQVREGVDDAGAFTVHRLETPPLDLPYGYHTLTVALGSRRPSTHVLLAAPDHVPGFGAHDRLWGVFSPVYALAGGSGLGANVGSLATLAAALDTAGGKVVGTLPLLAAWLGEPFDPSPYAPVSRLFWNDLYVDLAALPELAASPKAASNLEGLRSVGHAANEKTRAFDYRHQHGFVRGVLEEVVVGIDDWPAALRESFRAATADGDLLDYARFRAHAEAEGAGWHDWAGAARAGTLRADDVDPGLVELYAFGHYAMQRDLERLDVELGRRGQRLYLDLPVGAHGAGYDTWKHRDRFVAGMSAGAPPDDFFAEGQNWGFPPESPSASRADGHRYLRDVLGRHMAVTGVLRLDHVMGLHRLFWVPDGLSARDGVYVRYPRDELFAVLAIEAHRHDCIVIGEDLGTVPPEIRSAMDEHGVAGMYVAQFNQPSWPGAAPVAPRDDQLASIDTHDTPTFAGWVHGLDIDRRHVIGQLGDDDAERERADRRQQVRNLSGFLVARGDIPRAADARGEPDEHALLEGVLRFLGDSDAPAVLVALDDLVGERNPQNVPGTLVDRPNWVQRFPIPVDHLDRHDAVNALFAVVQACRLGSHLRSKAST